MITYVCTDHGLISHRDMERAVPLNEDPYMLAEEEYVYGCPLCEKPLRPTNAAAGKGLGC